MPSLAHRRQMSELPFRRGPASGSPRPLFMRQRSTTLESLSVVSSATGRQKPIEMSSELKAAKLQVRWHPSVVQAGCEPRWWTSESQPGMCLDEQRSLRARGLLGQTGGTALFITSQDCLSAADKPVEGTNACLHYMDLG